MYAKRLTHIQCMDIFFFCVEREEEARFRLYPIEEGLNR